MRISTKTLSLMAGSLFLVGVAAGAIVGCGGSSSNDFVSTCTEVCNKEFSCLADGGVSISNTQALCMSQCMQMASGANCSNSSEVSTAIKACLKDSDCNTFQACFDAAPQCGPSGTGTGGSSSTGAGNSSGAGTGGSSGTGTGGHTAGTGGSTGAAGSGGTADCSICDKANTCCMAEASMFNSSPSDCMFSNTACTASGSSSATYAMGCQQVLTVGQALSLSACQ